MTASEFDIQDATIVAAIAQQEILVTSAARASTGYWKQPTEALLSPCDSMSNGACAGRKWRLHGLW